MSDYYQRNFKKYHEKTFFIDPSNFLSPLVKRLAPGSGILDVGCGSGRDLLWLKKQGFKVKSFERSPGLVEIAKENTGCEVIEGDFELYDFSILSVDAIVLVGALVHIPHGKIKKILDRITQALCSHGRLFVSLKEGEGTNTDSYGRVFYLWQDKDLRALFTELGFRVLEFLRQISKIGTDEVWLGYVLEKA